MSHKMKILSFTSVFSLFVANCFFAPCYANDALPADTGAVTYQFCNKKSSSLDVKLGSLTITINTNDCQPVSRLDYARAIYSQVDSMCGDSSKIGEVTYVYIREC